MPRKRSVDRFADLESNSRQGDSKNFLRSSQNFASYDLRRQKRNMGGSPSPIKMGAMLSSFSAQKNLPYMDESRKANAT